MKKIETIEEKASYGIGLQIGQQLRNSGMNNLDIDALTVGLTDVLNDRPSTIPMSEVNQALKSMHDKEVARLEQKNQKIIEDGNRFLDENRVKSGVQTTDSGLQYEILSTGNGIVPKATDTVKVHYVGKLLDGTVFDSSVDRGEPAQFPVNGVIKGWVEALQMMPVGSKWRVYIPHALAYGSQGAGSSIPPFSTLIFDVELLDII